MNTTKAVSQCKGCKFILASVFWIIFCLMPYRAWSSLPELIFTVSTSENTINMDNQTVSFDTVSITSGGGILEADINGKPTVMVVSFGQPFAGRLSSTTARDNLISHADRLYETGAAFLKDEDIFRKGLVKSDDPDDLNNLVKDVSDGKATYNENDLVRAEEAYRRALFVDPFCDDAVKGILMTRQARAKKRNLVWDIRRRHQLRLRLTDSGLDTGKDVLEKEIDILEEISINQKDSIALLLELFSDPVFRGPGAALRGEFSIEESDVVDKTLQLLFSSGRRFAETELKLANKRLLLNFFNDGSSENDYNRAYALAQLANAHAYLTELMRLVNPFIEKSFYETSEVLQLASIQAKQNELVGCVEQGYNPFGFLPDFVPFVTGNEDDNNLSTFNKMYDIAGNAAALAQEKEATAQGQENRFADSSAQYRQRLLDTETSYTQRLKTLIGVVVGENEDELPDVFTFLIPDRDLDGDGISERDEERALLTNQFGLQFKSKGQISLQYDNIATAENRVEQALNEIRNVVDEIEIREQTAQKILDIHEVIAKLIKDNGDEVGLLIRQKGRLQNEAAKRVADKQRNSNLFGQLYEGGKDACEKLKNYFGIKAATANAMQPKDGGISITAIIAIAGTVLSTSDSVIGSQAAGDISEIQGQCAEDVANIDAQINEIQAMTNADIEVARGSQELLRTEQEVKILVLKQANLGLTKAIAQRDLDREMKELLNLIDEANTLLIDRTRTIKLAEKNFEGNAIGWVEEDVRDVLTNGVLVADQAFFRAQVWTFIALRALEYYANRPPDANGQPNWQIRCLYKKLYEARRGQDLIELLTDMEAKAKSDFVFTATSIACPVRGLLSLKYDVLVPTIVQYGTDGNPTESGVDKEAHYRYMDQFSGQTYEGVQAYQAVFRNVLRQGLKGTKENENRTLTLVFSTDLFPRNPSEGFIGDNPFYIASARNAKIIGFTNSSCTGPGLEENVQGIQINMTGKMDEVNGPWIRLAQLGNSYLKHTQWSEENFDEHGQLIDPLKSITVYSAYKQILPTWLIGDIDHSSSEQEEIGNSVLAVFLALRNGQGSAGKTLAFTDRSVANDRWELQIWEKENAANITFLNKIEEMLNSPIPESPSEDFLTDIQLWVGWAYRNPSAYTQMEDSGVKSPELD